MKNWDKLSNTEDEEKEVLNMSLTYLHNSLKMFKTLIEVVDFKAQKPFNLNIDERELLRFKLERIYYIYAAELIEAFINK